jgi:hypothetical protein
MMTFEEWWLKSQGNNPIYGGPNYKNAMRLAWEAGLEQAVVRVHNSDIGCIVGDTWDEREWHEMKTNCFDFIRDIILDDANDL